LGVDGFNFMQVSCGPTNGINDYLDYVAAGAVLVASFVFLDFD
jgi:hypothetical protein